MFNRTTGSLPAFALLLVALLLGSAPSAQASPAPSDLTANWGGQINTVQEVPLTCRTQHATETPKNCAL
jgi:hypothetical protein